MLARQSRTLRKRQSMDESNTAKSTSLMNHRRATPPLGTGLGLLFLVCCTSRSMSEMQGVEESKGDLEFYQGW
jgi:hypothetical protein